jgi:hypothetical protein
METEHKAIFGRWLNNTVKSLLKSADRLKVKDTEALKKSIKTNLSDAGEGILRGELSFLNRGRFVDMGAGRRAKNSFTNNRKPKRWYSRPFYGRLNDLEGVLGISTMEESIKSLKEAEDGGKGG